MIFVPGDRNGGDGLGDFTDAAQNNNIKCGKQQT